ncbi:MAG: beta-lactamase family protein [Chloroflexi bacterium]|nr:beta-lactamase family protein [Chloroflexota bacterium]
MQDPETFPYAVMPPESVGLCSKRLGRVTRLLEGYVERGQVAGFLAAVARKGYIVYSECIGWADREAGLPIRPDTIFRIYSMSKPITAVALMMLYEEGCFRLDDPVSTYIPAFKEMPVYAGGAGSNMVTVPPERPMTIRHLFTHTSGLVYPAGILDSEQVHPVERLFAERLREHHGGDSDWLFDGDLAAFVEFLPGIPLAHHPGTEWHYSVSIDVLGRLVEIFSGKRFGAFLQERLFEPLGMRDTAFFVPPEKLGRFSAVYGPDEAGCLVPIDRREGGFSRPRAFEMPGGGLVATAGDYLRFAQMMLNGGVLGDFRALGRKTVEFMCADHMPPTAKPFSMDGNGMWHGYGHALGFAMVKEPALTGLPHSKGTFHWAGAAATYFWVDPQEELIGLLMPQFMGMGRAFYPFQEQFRTLVYQALVD